MVWLCEKNNRTRIPREASELKLKGWEWKYPEHDSLAEY
jgi:hypothetical protein